MTIFKKGDTVSLRHAPEKGVFPVLGVLPIPADACLCGDVSVHDEKGHRPGCPKLLKRIIAKHDQEVLVNLGSSRIISLPGSCFVKCD